MDTDTPGPEHPVPSTAQTPPDGPRAPLASVPEPGELPPTSPEQPASPPPTAAEAADHQQQVPPSQDDAFLTAGDQDDDLLDDDFTGDAFDDLTDSAAVLQRVSNNNGTVIGVLIKKGIHRLQGIPLPAGEVDEYLASYVRHDADHLAINKILDEHHVLVLTGSEGSGRFTTALDVLHTRVGANIRQVRREPGDRFAIEGLREYDTGWILDLRSEQPPPALGRQLTQDTPQLTSTGSYLVVLCHPKAWKASGSGAAHLTRNLSKPDPQAVLRRHLDQAAFPISTARWLGEPVITEGIANRTPARVVTWAKAIIAAERLYRRRRPASPAQDEAAFRDLVLEVAHAAENWHDQLLDWHTENTNSDYRNYLLAAAVLEGATAETVYTASAELARALDEDPTPRPGQQGLGVIALTHTANADLGSDGIIRFRHPGYAQAVIDYFLADRPHLLGAFTRWTAAQTSSLDSDLAAPLAERVSQWALNYTARKRTTRLLRALAEQWAPTMPGPASNLLVAAGLDPAVGQRARNAYRRWTTDDADKLPASLKVVLAQACRQLATVYPTSMLGRLADLAATPGNTKVTNAVSEALTALWQEPGQRSTIQKHLTQWATDDSEARCAAAHVTFAYLAHLTTPNGPALLADKDVDIPWMTDMWRGALSTVQRSPVLSQALSAWMDAVLTIPELHPIIWQIFLDAVHRPTDAHYSARRFLTMQHLLFAWAPATQAHDTSASGVLRDQMLTELRAADPAAPPEPDATTAP
ncbi:hypothetical protein ACFWIJ_00255 [Streptomyces sp. NPDC127079]|uniref:hypothetical protein n=1 Tax=Streptomyces sp. NPDC127079 TaxID=3347132 RepID=UPI00366841B2